MTMNTYNKFSNGLKLALSLACVSALPLSVAVLSTRMRR